MGFIIGNSVDDGCVVFKSQVIYIFDLYLLAQLLNGSI